MIQNYKKLFFFSFSSSDYPIYSLSMGFFLNKGDLEGKVEMKSSLYISTLNQTEHSFSAYSQQPNNTTWKIKDLVLGYKRNNQFLKGRGFQ